MWIKYRDVMYNTDVMKEIKQSRTMIKGVYPDGSEVILGRFKTMEDCKNHFIPIVQNLLAAGTDHEGVIIRDTKPSFSKKGEKK